MGRILFPTSCNRNLLLLLATLTAAGISVFAAGAKLEGVRKEDDSRVGSSSNQCPEGMSFIDTSSVTTTTSGMTITPLSFCIDQFEATVEVDISAGAPSPRWTLNAYNFPLDSYDQSGTPYRAAVPKSRVIINSSSSSSTTPIIPPPPRSEKPQAYISQAQSRKACETAGKRLCNLTEYRLGCGGPTTKWTYPYGNTFQPGTCNTGHASPVLRIFGENALFNFIEMNNPVLDTLDHTLEFAADKYKNCTNPVTRTYDQAGSLDEWVADITPEGHGVFAGGYFVDDVINGPGCTYETVAHDPTYHDYSLGFRCCKSA